MAKRPTTSTLTNTASPTYLTQLNQNFTNVRNQFDNTLSLDGSTPNAMNADIDLNGNDLINANSVNTASLRIGGQAVVASDAVNQTVKKEFETVALLLADTGTYTNYAVDDYLRVVDGGFVYKVAASGASDQDLTTAGGVKLYVLSDLGGLAVKAFGAGTNTTADGSAVRSALVRAAANSETLWFDSGTYDLSTMVAVTLSGSVVLRGSGKSLVNLIGANGKSLFTLAAGGSFSASGLGFTTWDSVCRLADNTVGGAFPFLEMDDCYLNGVNYSAIWDGAVYAPGGITELRWTRNLSVSCGRINANAAALRLDVDNIISAFVDGNEIRGVGGSGFSGQKQGIQLGAISRTSNASMIVTNNRIFDVQNSDTSNVSGIIVFGYNTNVSGNTIHTVKSASASNIDQYGIYTKSAFSVIIGNILTDAGGNAACIMTKGFPNDVNGFALNSTNLRNIISKNTVRLESRWTTQVMNGIAFYNSGMMVSENIIDGVTVGIVAIPPVSAAVEHCTIRGNKISNLSGQASQTAVGIQVSSPAFCTIESNEVQNVGSGVETRAYGISMVNDANGVFGTFQGLFITNNLIRKALASTTANSRGIMLAFFASGSFSFLKVEGNVVDECPLGIQSAFGGTYSDIHFRNNILRNCSVSYLAWSGTPPADGVMAGNIINGLPYTTIAAGVTTPSVGGVNHIRTANVGATTITNLTNGYGNQSVLLEVNDNFTTVQHGANIKLAGSVNWVPANGGILHLIRMGSTWKEVGRVTY